MEQPDLLYEKARAILAANPAMGKKRLAVEVGVKTPTSRRLIERYRGEIQGHSADPVYQQVRRLKDAQPDIGARRVAQALKMTEDHAKLHLARWRGAQDHKTPATISAAPPLPEPETPPPGSTLQDTVQDDSRSLSSLSPHIRTIEDLMIYAQVDDRVWEPYKVQLNKWDMGAKNPVTGEVLTHPLYQVKALLRRKILANELKDLMRGLLADFKQTAPLRPAIVHSSRGDGMLEISIMDLHYGKIAWGEECGRDYDPEIAEQLYWDALEDLLAKGSSFKPGKILLPCGNDFFNTDILGRTTTAGTPQDEGQVWKKSFRKGKSLLVRAIQRLRQVAPVTVVMVAGNHDVQSNFHVGEVLEAWFHGTEDVRVDNSPSQRKYYTHGRCLLGLTHGNQERFSNLGLLMAQEKPAEWAASSVAAREWHVGHYHSKRSLRFMPATDVGGGVLIRVVPSLCPADSWHASKGYHGKPAAEAFYWTPDEGIVATLTHFPL